MGRFDLRLSQIDRPDHQAMSNQVPLPTQVLVLPGVYGSGPGHWQSRWEAANPAYLRVMQRDWDHPVCEEWMQELERTVAQSGANTVLAAHSLGCLLTAHWAARTRLRIKAALLVAVPDPATACFPAQAIGFSGAPRQRLPFDSVVVASSNDPYASLAYAQTCATAWGSRFVSIGAAGHINADSGLGNWEAGHELLRALMTGPGTR